jgi:Lipocalin-like domain
VSIISEMDDGKTAEPFGASPKGVIIFANDGHFSLFQSRAEIVKIAANDRARATPEEAQSIVALQHCVLRHIRSRPPGSAQQRLKRLVTAPRRYRTKRLLYLAPLAGRGEGLQ